MPGPSGPGGFAGGPVPSTGQGWPEQRFVSIGRASQLRHLLVHLVQLDRQARSGSVPPWGRPVCGTNPSPALPAWEIRSTPQLAGPLYLPDSRRASSPCWPAGPVLLEKLAPEALEPEGRVPPSPASQGSCSSWSVSGGPGITSSVSPHGSQGSQFPPRPGPRAAQGHRLLGQPASRYTPGGVGDGRRLGPVAPVARITACCCWGPLTWTDAPIFSRGRGRKQQPTRPGLDDLHLVLLVLEAVPAWTAVPTG
jgi:hypothetical protein